MSLTGLNSTLSLTVPGLFPSPVTLQGYTADDIFDSENVTLVETQMGVDGNLSAGLVNNERIMNIHLQSDSPSCFLFDQWEQAMFANQDTLVASMTVRMISIGTKFNCSNGFLTAKPPMPSVGKLVKPRVYRIVWGIISAAPS